jgi:hypothetical protein
MRSTGLAVPYLPINDRVLLAIRSLLDGKYQEARQARPGDEVVFVRSATGDIGRFATLLGRVAVNKTVDWSDQASGGLPAGWVALRLRLREDLAEHDIPAELRKRIRVGGARVRLFGGLRIRRAWMAGAGPTLEVVGGTTDVAILDGDEWELSGGRLYPESCPQLNQVGTHEVWLPDWHRDPIRFRVMEPPLARFRSPVVGAGWRRVAEGWPELFCPVDDTTPAVRGPVVQGEWPPEVGEALPAETLAIPLALMARGIRTAGLLADRRRLREAAGRHRNLLIRQLAKAVPPVG